jgi:hypothetical protein
VRGVRFSPALRWFILLLLPITLGWKLAVRPAADLGERNDKQVQLEVAEFLARQHFSVASSEHIEAGRPMIQATAGGCRMLIAKSPAIGSDRDVLRRYAEAADQVFVVFRGKVYADQPDWLTVSDFLWARFRRELGFDARAAPVLAVIAGANCGADRLSWEELG